MPQATIRSFFAPNKKAAPPPKEPAPKSRKIDPDAAHNTSSPLASYAHGQTVNPQFYESSENVKRHEAFRSFLMGLKSRKNSEVDGTRRKMKPYDLQFIELKKKNKEAILMVQNGYKYQILGEDAFRVARFLGRSPISGWRTLEDEGDPVDALYDRFASLTFPIERLPFYVEKLVMQGLKVAVAKQLETSALKAQGDNKRGPFRREVTDTYTKGTMVEELTSSSLVTGHLLAIVQNGHHFSIIAVQPATGDGLYDSFEDSSVAVELETRLLHIQPSEILIVGNELEGAARKLINSMDLRTVFLQSMGTKPLVSSGQDTAIPDPVKADASLLECWDALHEYLAEFKLEDSLHLDLQPFTLQSFMYLNGDTLQSLEIFENQTTNQPIGSLLWALDMTKTAFGKRLLRSWIGKPLMDRELLAERIEAMEEIMDAEGRAAEMFASLQSAMARLPDLERYTLQIYHGRINPKQLYWCLYFFNVILSSITEPQITAARVRSPLLDSILSAFAPAQRVVSSILKSINASFVRSSRDNSSNVSPAYFNLDAEHEGSQRDDFALLESFELRISKCREEFRAYLESESESLGIPLKQVNAQGEEDTFVIGVAKRDASKVPASWRRQGAVSTEVRFWAPFSIEQTKKLKPLLEQQAATLEETYHAFVAEIASEHFEELRNCVHSLSRLDCLLSMAAVSSRKGYVKPDLVDEPCLEIEDGRHPMLEQLVLTGVIPNSAHMYSSENRVMIITGANMGGKSSFVRQVALIVVMAQIGCYVPASRARMSVMDAVFTRMGAFDNLLRGESTFMVELKECSAILSRATPRSLVLMDEIGRGTSTMDGVAIADAVLQYMIEDLKCFTLFITHYPLLCEKAALFGKSVRNWSMDCAEEEDEVTFLYKVVPRQASRSYGINVARLAGLPASILEAAQTKSSEFENLVHERRQRAVLVNDVLSVLKSGDEASLSRIKELADHTREEVCETQQ